MSGGMSVDRIEPGQCPDGIVSHVHYKGKVIAIRPIRTDRDLSELQRFTKLLPGALVISYDGDSGQRIDLGFVPGEGS